MTEEERDALKCKYNDGINCRQWDKCLRCGWNPEVERDRKRRLEERGELHPKVKIKKAYSDEFCASYILEHAKMFHGSMTMQKIRETLGLNSGRFNKIMEGIYNELGCD